MSEERDFDGILCFGQVDWWYHNRTHFDLQIMKRFAKKTPVLYVNSIGMRRPKPAEGKVFIARLINKGRSFLRGFKEVDDNFFVYSPVNVPGNSGAAWAGKLLLGQIKIALHRAGIKKPFIWLGCPTAYFLLRSLDYNGLVYQRTDRYEAYKGVDNSYISDIDRKLKREADMTVFCSSLLYEKEQEDCRKALYIEHGVDYDYFAGAGENSIEPADIAEIKRPRAVYVGGMSEGVFDPEFMCAVAKKLPEWNFVLVGDSKLREGWADKDANIYLLGQRDYSEVAAYMAAGDVLIMPWCRNEWIEVCNPVKMKEYLAVGKGVVSTPFYELKYYRDTVCNCATVEEFAEAIVKLEKNPPAVDFLRQRVKNITWDRQAEKIWDEMV